MTGPTRFGVFMAPFHALNENPTQAIRRDVELAEHLDRLGYQELWVGEHHSGGFEIISQPEIFIAAAAERTKNIRLGTGVKSLPFYHPMIVADMMAQLDHMSQGRVLFGVGPGALPSDAYQMGIEVADQRRRMDEAIEVIIPLLQGETVSRESDWFTLNEARLQLSCYTKPRMEMAVTSMRSPAGMIAAGKYGLGVLVLGGVSDEALAHYVDNWGICQETAEEHGNTVSRDDWRITMMVHCAETREQALKDVEFGFGAWARYAQDVLPASPVPKDAADPIAYAQENKVAVFGTPDDIIAEIERVSGAVGGFGTMLIFANNWARWDATLKSYELISRYVAPHFTGARDGRIASYDMATEKHDGFSQSFMKASDASREAYEAKKAVKGKAAE